MMRVAASALSHELNHAATACKEGERRKTCEMECDGVRGGEVKKDMELKHLPSLLDNARFKPLKKQSLRVSNTHSDWTNFDFE